MIMTNAIRGSATVYEFPLRGRFAVNIQRGDSELAAVRTPSPAAAVAIGGAWYHDEAIEAEHPRKN
jgi:hypothetical protein